MLKMLVEDGVVISYELKLVQWQDRKHAFVQIRRMDSITTTTIKKTPEGYQLLANGEPFYIKGAGLEFGNVADAAFHGANSFRTWRVENVQKSG